MIIYFTTCEMAAAAELSVGTMEDEFFTSERLTICALCLHCIRYINLPSTYFYSN